VELLTLGRISVTLQWNYKPPGKMSKSLQWNYKPLGIISDFPVELITPWIDI